MDIGLAGQVILIVGGSGLIGRAVARTAIADGATVILAARNRETLEEAAQQIGAQSIVFDAADTDQTVRAVNAIRAEHGRIDALVVTSAPSAQTLDSSRDRDPRQIVDALEGKALSFLRVAEAVTPGMVEAGYGRIVGISGQNARLTGSITGAVRNQALITIAKILADSSAGTGVTVNVVNPGPVSDNATHSAPAPAKPGDSTPDEVAALVTFLASPAAAGISGESIAVGHKVLGVSG